MSESNEHRKLVINMAKKLQAMNSSAQIMADISQCDYWETPPTVGGLRPDIYVSEHQFGRLIICEAKTWPDLRTARSEHQIVTFLLYLDGLEVPGCFTLGVYGHEISSRGKAALEILSTQNDIKKCCIQIYDGLDYWRYEQKKEGRQWHLI